MSLTVQVSNNEVTVSQNPASSVTVSQEATPTVTVSATGLVGPSGAQGVAGSNGAQGAQGAAGTNGTNGTNGAQGAQGSAGNNGTNGAQGAQGASGAGTFPYSGTAQVTGSVEVLSTGSANAIFAIGDAGIKVSRYSSAFGFGGSAWGGYLYPLNATTLYNQAGGILGSTKNPLTLQPLSTAQDVALSTVNYGAALLISASNEIYLGYGANTASKTYVRDLFTVQGTLSGSRLYVSSSLTAAGGVTGSLLGTATTASYISPTFISASAAAAGFGNTADTSQFATTGSNTFFGDQVVNGAITLDYGAVIKDNGSYSVAFGLNAAYENQGTQSVAIGNGAGYQNQSNGAVALGTNAGAFNQGQRAVALGSLAGTSNQGEAAIAIGNFAGPNNQGANSIIISALGTFLENTVSSSLVIAPIRNVNGDDGVLQYNTTTNEVSYATTLNGITNLTTTASFNEFTSSQEITNANVNDDINILYDTKLNTSSFNDYTSSLATTGSNTFIGNQVVSGSLRVTGSLVGSVQPLTIASSTASLSMSGSNFYTLQLVVGANTYVNPTNILPGQTVSLRVNTTGSGTVSFPSIVKQPSGSSYTPTTSTGVDVLTLITFDSTNVYLANVKNLI